MIRIFFGINDTYLQRVFLNMDISNKFLDLQDSKINENCWIPKKTAYYKGMYNVFSMMAFDIISYYLLHIKITTLYSIHFMHMCSTVGFFVGFT